MRISENPGPKIWTPHIVQLFFFKDILKKGPLAPFRAPSLRVLPVPCCQGRRPAQALCGPGKVAFAALGPPKNAGSFGKQTLL